MTCAARQRGSRRLLECWAPLRWCILGARPRAQPTFALRSGSDLRARPRAAAVLGSGVPGADERRVAEVMGAIADRVCDQFQRPYTFPSYHARILHPYNYYDFGQARAQRCRAPQ